jgi:tetratricopeptide (TPR) repeat protein
MMKACVTRLWLSAVLLAGLLLGAFGSELCAQSPGSAAHAPSSADRKAQLAQAAKLADAGKYSAAMAIYRRAFGAHPPPGDLALAYYETEAATEGGRPQAADGLRVLVEKYPADPRYPISLGRILTFDPATREQGRTYLAKFPDNPQAAQALRQSLLWDAANPAAVPQIRAYLAAHPDPQLAAVFQAAQPEAAKTVASAAIAPDHGSSVAAKAGDSTSMPIVVTPASSRAATAASYASASQHVSAYPVLPVAKATATPQASATVPPPAAVTSAAHAPVNASLAPVASSVAAPRQASIQVPSAAAEVAAYQALNANRIDEAKTRFKAILAAAPGNERALAGMGYVLMQQSDFAGAIQYLDQAKRIDAAGSVADKGLLAALDTARFWFAMGEGHNALAANDLTTAEKQYRAALATRPDNVEALEGLGGTLVKAQQPGPAIGLYEHATEIEPASVDGWRGLFLAQLHNDQAARALATYERMPATIRAQLRGDPSFLELVASVYAAVGRNGEAQATLEDALKLPFVADQSALKVEIQMELAGILSSTNHIDQAVILYKQVAAEDPGDAAAWQDLAQMQHAIGRDQDALATVQRMPAATYAAAMRAPGFEVMVASIYERMKKLDLAQDLLQKAVTDESNAGQKPSPAIEMQLADIYAERGNPQLAYPVYQQVLREDPDRADAWAGLLSALHVTGHDKEAVAQVALIPEGARGQLDTNQSYLRTMAAVYARIGQTQEASQVQGRVAREDSVERSAPPSEAEIQRAWLLYNGMDDAGLYAQLMGLGGRSDLTADQRRTVETIWTNWAARRADQASAVNNPRRAAAILNAAARAFPDNPAAIRLLAAAYMQAGQPHQAVLIYKAQNMASASASEYQAAVSAALADGDNKDAEIWLRYALAASPADPQILLLAARFEQARGDTTRAMQYYRSSLKAMPPVNTGSKLASELGLPAPAAPMSLPSASQPQDLSVLLAPG